MAGVPFTEVDVTGLKLVVSCYMGPCSATINVQGGSDYIKGLKVCWWLCSVLFNDPRRVVSRVVAYVLRVGK